MRFLYLLFLSLSSFGLEAQNTSHTLVHHRPAWHTALKKPFKVLKNKHLEPIDPVEFWSILGACGVLVITGGIFAGLTIGLMSLDATNISILKASGTPKQKMYAARIEPIRKNTHLLLVTLLLGNTVVNETLPVLFHTIHLDGYQAVLISTALIVIFGEYVSRCLFV